MSLYGVNRGLAPTAIHVAALRALIFRIQWSRVRAYFRSPGGDCSRWGSYLCKNVKCALWVETTHCQVVFIPARCCQSNVAHDRMSSTSPRPTQVRYAVVLATTLTAILLYLDRICMGQIAENAAFKESLGGDQGKIGSVLSAFFLAYALAQVPAGWLSDRFGARAMMTFYVVMWSAFTAFTGIVTGFTMLLVARIGCGLAQAGAYPTSGSLLGRWVPLRARSRANSVVAFGGRLGGALAPVLTVALITGVASWPGLGNWRTVLIIYGAVGIGVAGLFWWVFRERPEGHPRCNSAECELINEGRARAVASSKAPPTIIPLRSLLTNRSMWLMCLSQWATNVGWVFLVTWLATYLTSVKHVSSMRAGQMASVVLLAGMGGMLCGGWLTDAATRRLGLRWGRVVPLASSRFIAALAYLVCLWFEAPWVAVAAFAMVAFMTDLGVPSTWSFMQDVGGRHVGSALGWANMWGNLGAFVATKYLPPLLERWDTNHDWHVALIVCAAGFVVSGIASLGIDASACRWCRRKRKSQLTNRPRRAQIEPTFA